MSQEDLARRAGVDPKTIRGIESGRRSPRPSTVRQLATAFRLTAADREEFYISSGSAPEPFAGDRPGTIVPAQLPPDLPGFTGRSHELAQLDTLLDTLLPADAAAAPGVLIAVVSGLPGAGKTALAVHWAHRVADRFPDGQLYIDLRGFAPDRAAMAPATAIRTLLGGLGIPADRVPTDPAAQVSLYRSQLAGKHVLVVLDNARSADQVHELLPGTATALVVVTSRDQLTPLVATHGARPVNLGVLSERDAQALLALRLSWPRLRAEPAAVNAIIAGCGGLPLALAVAATRARQTGFPLAAVAAELADVGQQLDALDGGDPSSQVRAVFSWSYRLLTPAAARLFRLLGAHPGPEFTIAAAASLAAEPQPTVWGILAELTRANLVIERRPGRYTLHHLLRSYAVETSAGHDLPRERTAALNRLFSHYLHTAQAADRLLDPHRDAIGTPLDPPVAGTALREFADRDQATAWLAAEYRVLVAVLRHAADNGFDREACQLTWFLDAYLDRYGHWQVLIAAWHTALTAARRLHDRQWQAHASHRIEHLDVRRRATA